MNKIKHLSVDERVALGKAAREQARPGAHAGWVPAADRPDPVALLEEQNATREPDLVPVRHGRMMVSPFTFYRGAAKIMAADLKDTPTAGLNVQLCGDAHLSNFGVFASPERDAGVRRERLRRDAARTVRVRREAHGGELHDRGAQQRLHRHARRTTRRSRLRRRTGRRWPGSREMRTMDIWYAHLSEADLMAALTAMTSSADRRGQEGGEDRREERRKNAEKARTRDSLQALSKLAELVDGQYRIVSQPPVVVPARDLAASIGMSADELEDTIHEQFRAYRATLQDDRRHLLERFEVVDVARKVVGVGSVGTRAFIVLLQGRDQQDPLFLQVKEATASVLEDHLPKSRYDQPGERVVQGQRMMQAASDIYLGWTKGAAGQPLPVLATAARHEGLGRRSRRWRRSPSRSTHGSAARPWHGRTPDPATRSRSPAYLGKKDQFDQSIADFSERYADQNEQDYQAFCDAIRSGRLEALEGV